MAVDPLPSYVLGPLFLVVALTFIGLFFRFASPPEQKPRGLKEPVQTVRSRFGQDRLYLTFGLCAVAGHIIQVNLLNPVTRKWWLGVTGYDFAGLIYSIEGDLVPSLSALHWGPLLFVMFWLYLVLHNTFVIIAPMFLAYTGERRLARRLLVSYLAIWSMALVGFTFFPADNPTIYLGLDSVLDRVIPGTTGLFYRGTTIDNTIPSLHVGLATLVMLHGVHAKNPRLRASVLVYAPAIAFSIVYLQVHWALDIVAGVAVAVIAYFIGKNVERRVRPVSDRYEDDRPASTR